MTESTAWPRVTVVVPMYNERRHIRHCLESILDQDYPADRFEILVVDGGSTDESRVIVAETAAGDPRVRLLDNPKRIIPAALNIGILGATGEVVLRMDGHSFVEPGYMRRCVELLLTVGAENVGGRTAPVGSTWLARSVAHAFTSRFGSGNAVYKSGRRAAYVDTVHPGCYWKRTLVELGGYDETFEANEDDELNLRLTRRGGRVFFDPELTIHYWPRASLRALWCQYWRYGFWKARVLRKHGRPSTWRQLFPPLFGGLLVGTGVLGVVHRGGRVLCLAVIGAYGLANLWFSLEIARRQSLRDAMGVPVVFPTMHVAYGLGFLAGVGQELTRGAGRLAGFGGSGPTGAGLSLRDGEQASVVIRDKS